VTALHDRDPPRAFRTSSSPPCLLPAFFSTAARAPPLPHSCCRLATRGRTHPIDVVTSTMGTYLARVAPHMPCHQGQHSHSPRAVQPHARCHPPSPPQLHSWIPLCSVSRRLPARFC
jgi:hypothetical protein